MFILLQLHMSSATEESNEKHLSPWSEACSRDGISNTPLSPYLDQELLYHKHLHVDGSKILQTGFSYEQPRPTVDLLREVCFFLDLNQPYSKFLFLLRL